MQGECDASHDNLAREGAYRRREVLKAVRALRFGGSASKVRTHMLDWYGAPVSVDTVLRDLKELELLGLVECTREHARRYTYRAVSLQALDA